MVESRCIESNLKFVEIFFSKIGWLDPFELENGYWQFISFPASLGARSWLEVMSNLRIMVSFWMVV